MNGPGQYPNNHLLQLTRGKKVSILLANEILAVKKKRINNNLPPWKLVLFLIYFFYSASSSLSLFDFSLICDVTPAIIHALHGLSGQIRCRGSCLDSHRTVSIVWWLRSYPSSHLLRVQRQMKRGSVTNLTPKSLQGIPFKKKQNLTWQSKASPGQE